MPPIRYTRQRQTEQGLSVGQTANAVGVTVRTLHHWDKIGLVRPSYRNPNGYRRYTATDIARIQRIVIYRALDVPLDEIRQLLDSQAAYSPKAALEKQRTRVVQEIKRLKQLKKGLERMMNAHEQGWTLTPEQQASLFGEDWDPNLMTEAHETWGETPQWAEYIEKAQGRTVEEWKTLVDAARVLERKLVEAFDRGVEPGTEEANALAQRHFEQFGDYFTITRNMHVVLGRMYEQDPRYAAYYNKIRPGLASWLRRVIDASARAQGIDPDQATWA